MKGRLKLSKHAHVALIFCSSFLLFSLFADQSPVEPELGLDFLLEQVERGKYVYARCVR